MRIAVSFILSVFLLHQLPSDTQAQSFSCPIGKTAACLDYNDKVCSMFAKCVDENAVCFSQYTCDYNGFVCKSTLNEVADDYTQLRNECLELEADYNSVVEKYNEILERFRVQSQMIDNLRSELSQLAKKHDNLRLCIEFLGEGEYHLDCL